MKNSLTSRLLPNLAILIALLLPATCRLQAQISTSARIPYDDLKRDTEAINTDLALATNKLNNARTDLYQSLCPHAEGNLVYAYANLDLARAKIPDLRDRLTLVEPNAFGGIKGRINKLRNDLTRSDSSASGIDRDLAGFARDFETRCPDHPRLDAYRKFKLEHQGSDLIPALKDLLPRIADPNFTPEVFTPSAPGPVSSNGGGADGSAQIKNFLSHLDDPGAKQALESVLENASKDPMSAEDAAKAADALAHWDTQTLEELLRKYPNNPVLQNMLREALKHEGKSDADVNRTISDIISGSGSSTSRTPPGGSGVASTSNNGGNSGSGSADPRKIDGQITMGGEILDKKNFRSADLYVKTTSSANGILTREEPITGQLVGNEWVPKTRKVIDWQFDIDVNDKGFKLIDRATAGVDPDRGFKVLTWRVTDPSGKTEEKGNGERLDYTMTSSGKYKIEAEVMTNLGTRFTIFTTPINN